MMFSTSDVAQGPAMAPAAYTAPAPGTYGDGSRPPAAGARWTGSPFLGGPADQSVLVIDAQEVRRAIQGRRKRDQFFGGGLFEEPVWDMMLELFASDLEGRRVSVSNLCVAAAVAPTTALRWISKLVDAGLFEREPDPLDRRRAFITLSDRAGEAMRRHVSELRRLGLSLV